MPPTKNFLLDGPLMTTPERRTALLSQMAQDLARFTEFGALESDRAAVRALLAIGYRTVEVAILAPEARMLAYQEIVAREMAK